MFGLDNIIILLTTVFSTEVLMLVIGVLLISLCLRRQFKEALWLIVSTVVMLISVIVLKDFFAVERPEDALVVLDSYAFPSGHATSVAFSAVVLWWYGVVDRGWSRWVITIVLTDMGQSDFRYCH